MEDSTTSMAKITKFIITTIFILGISLSFVPIGCFDKVCANIDIHFLELGNASAGDCIYIKAGETDILIDAGSKANSLDDITNYIDNYITDGKIEYAIITHAHEDHYACYATSDWEKSLFSQYQFGTIITFAGSKSTAKQYTYFQNNLEQTVSTYKSKHYTALECVNGENGAQQEYQLAEGITLKILDSYYYENVDSNENNNSVCFLITQGSKNYLFTGDLEKEGEKSLVKLNDLPKCDLYKAGHHGSGTSSIDELLSKIANVGENRLNVVVTCVAGSTEYTNTISDIFPTQDMIDRVAKYTDKVYVTSMVEYEYSEDYIIEPNGTITSDNYKSKTLDSMNGCIVYRSNGSYLEINCSNNTTKLKDTDWMFEWRIIPEEWR